MPERVKGRKIEVLCGFCLKYTQVALSPIPGGS